MRTLKKPCVRLLPALFSFIFIAFLATSCRQHKDAEKSIAFRYADDYWTTFRKQFPYHSQTLAISPKEADSSFALILSEPPPHITLDSIQSLFQGRQFQIREKTNTIGYDGWVKDIVVVVSEADEEDLDELTKKASKLMFGTDYKASLLPFTEIETTATEKPSTNYDITAAELYTWLLKEGEQFVDGTNQPVGELKDLLATGYNDVYFSQQPGLVVWLLPRTYIDDYKVAARVFAVESDLIFGAVETSNKLAIIGRKRKVPEWQLPPLRVESIMGLAAADKEQIAQSYERTKPFAGKLEGGKDWAPIYLSQDLINTEYGSLLNITDQLLKSWSENGSVSYANFVYPKPREWCFDKPMSSHLKTDRLLFNWNTKNAVYAVNVDNSYTVYGLNRTGSLPVSYNPDDENHNLNKPVLAAEDAAYQFFSTLNDPNLARVVQYAALYEIFSKSGVTSFEKNTGFYHEDVIENHLADIFRQIAGMDKQGRKKFINNVVLPLIKADSKGVNDIPEYYDFLITFMVNDFFDEWDRRLQLKPQGYLRDLSKVVCGNHDFTPESIETEEDYKEALAFSQFLHKNDLVFKFITKGFNKVRNEIKEEYVASYAASASTWIKTPSIVLSWGDDSAIVEGGHNIDVAINQIEKSSSLERGYLRIEKLGKETKVYLSEIDLLKIKPSVITKYERIGAGEYNIAADLAANPLRQRQAILPSSSFQNNTFQTSRSSAKFNWIYTESGERFGIKTVGNQQYRTHPMNPNIFIPEHKIASYKVLTETMKKRLYIPEEMQVLSFIKDDKTNDILSSYLHGQVKTNVKSITDLKTAFQNNPKKSFILFGHIENKQFIMNSPTGMSTAFPIDEIQALAKQSDVNTFLFGCESSFVNNNTGFLHKFNSIDAAEKLGFALKRNTNVWDFMSDISDSRFQLIIDDLPLADKGYYQMLKQSNQVAGQVYITIGGTAVVVTIAAMATSESKEPKDSTNKPKTT